MNTVLFRTRVPKTRLKRAEKVLRRLGLRPGDAFNMLLARNRSPESYVAGGIALNAAEPVRWSADVDVFHDVEEAVIRASEADAETLRRAGCAIRPEIWTPTFRRAWVERQRDGGVRERGRRGMRGAGETTGLRTTDHLPETKGQGTKGPRDRAAEVSGLRSEVSEDQSIKLQRCEDLLAIDAFGGGDFAQDRIERADAQRLVVGD